MKFFCLILSILAFASVCFAQIDGKRDAVRLERGKPSAYITFEKYGKRIDANEVKSRESIWLRFHNNTKWNLTIGTLGCKTIQEECLVFYDVKSKDLPNDKIPLGRTSRHVSAAMIIPSGKTVLFSVPTEHLADGLYITVDFSYEWEQFGDTGGGTLDIVHKATYFSFDLPKEKKS